MAVAVRRLHDTGKSGWMMLIGLIPVIGGIWLLILMLTDGQPGENKYGPNPKTSPEIFSESTKLKSAGITLIVAASIAILAGIAQDIMIYERTSSHGEPLHFSFYINLILRVLLLAAGVFLTQERHIYGMWKKGRSAMFLLFTFSVVSILMTVSVIFSRMSAGLNIGGIVIVNDLIALTSYFLLTFLAVSILYSPQNKDMIRNTAIWIIVFFGSNMLFMIYYGIRMGGDGGSWTVIINILGVFFVLLPIAFIVLAGMFLSKKTFPTS